jgi:hypothetical protein
MAEEDKKGDEKKEEAKKEAGKQYTYDKLKHMTVVQLREIAKATEHEALKGYTQLNKAHLITALCKALGVDPHVHHEAKGIEKSALKSRLKELKKQRDAALAAHDHAQLKAVRRHIHRINHIIRSHSV